MLDRDLKRVIAGVSVATLMIIIVFVALAVLLTTHYDVGVRRAYAEGTNPTQTPTPFYSPSPIRSPRVIKYNGNEITGSLYLPFNSANSNWASYGITVDSPEDHDTYYQWNGSQMVPTETPVDSSWTKNGVFSPPTPSSSPASVSLTAYWQDDDNPAGGNDTPSGQVGPTTAGAPFTINLIQVDLDIDVNDDGPADDIDEQMEENPGAIIFENWDNDDADTTHTADKDKTSVANENDLVEIYPKIAPSLNVGTLKLEATAGGSRVKVWSSATKGTEIELPKTWNLATDSVPYTLYLEGYDESTAANDVELRLSYANGDSTICEDKIKVTVVRLNLGVAVYRDLAMYPYTIGHAGMITGYAGLRTKEELNTNSNWITTESAPGGIHLGNLQSFIDSRPPLRAICSVNALSDIKRNEILKNARDCLSAGIGYISADMISWKGDTWDGTIADIEELRCDGLVEVCYELAGIDVWGPYGTHYPIQTYYSEHQDLGMDNPDECSPIIQRGGVTFNPPTTKFILDSLFQPQTLP